MVVRTTKSPTYGLKLDDTQPTGTGSKSLMDFSQSQARDKYKNRGFKSTSFPASQTQQHAWIVQHSSWHNQSVCFISVAQVICITHNIHW